MNAVFRALRARPGIFEVLTYRVSEVDTAVYLFRAQKETVLRVLAEMPDA